MMCDRTPCGRGNRNDAREITGLTVQKNIDHRKAAAYANLKRCADDIAAQKDKLTSLLTSQ